MPAPNQCNLLDVDLATARITRRETPEEILRLYRRGSGLAARMSCGELQAAVDFAAMLDLVDLEDLMLRVDPV